MRNNYKKMIHESNFIINKVKHEKLSVDNEDCLQVIMKNRNRTLEIVLGNFYIKQNKNQAKLHFNFFVDKNEISELNDENKIRRFLKTFVIKFLISPLLEENSKVG